MTTPTPTPFEPLVRALESAEALDAPGQKIGKAVRNALSAGGAKDAISGGWFGHTIHPPLTDVVIGSFLSASLLDLLGSDSGDASERLIGVGLAAAAPTALTGTSDWADSEPADPRVRRVGLVHAATNASALVLYAASLGARRRGARKRGTALALAGATVLSVGGYLGGHMSFTRGVGGNQTAFDPGPDEWTAVLDADALPEGEPKSAVAGDTPVLLLRHGTRVHALHDRCSHRGCSLSEGELDGHVVTCTCHGSQFDLADGSVLRGPATSPQPAFETRESDGRIELRLRQT